MAHPSNEVVPWAHPSNAVRPLAHQQSAWLQEISKYPNPIPYVQKVSEVACTALYNNNMYLFDHVVQYLEWTNTARFHYTSLVTAARIKNIAALELLVGIGCPSDVSGDTELVDGNVGMNHGRSAMDIALDDDDRIMMMRLEPTYTDSHQPLAFRAIERSAVKCFTHLTYINHNSLLGRTHQHPGIIFASAEACRPSFLRAVLNANLPSIDINQRNKLGRTALHYFLPLTQPEYIHDGFQESFTRLLQMGVDSTAIDAYGLQALSYLMYAPLFLQKHFPADKRLDYEEYCWLTKNVCKELVVHMNQQSLKKGEFLVVKYDTMMIMQRNLFTLIKESDSANDTAVTCSVQLAEDLRNVLLNYHIKMDNIDGYNLLEHFLHFMSDIKFPHPLASYMRSHVKILLAYGGRVKHADRFHHLVRLMRWQDWLRTVYKCIELMSQENHSEFISLLPQLAKQEGLDPIPTLPPAVRRLTTRERRRALN